MSDNLRTRTLTSSLKSLWDEKPLALIMALAIVFRLLASIFARGWGMLDDHFLVIEPPYSWTMGHDYADWLPGSRGNTGPTGHNFFYPGIHFLLFTVFRWIHLDDPQTRMMLIRLLHAGLSLITVIIAYKIVDTLEGKKPARLAGLLLAVYYFMPWISVRNLTESTCIPFVMLGLWQFFRNPAKEGAFRTGLLAGIFFGLASDIRYQVVLYPAGMFFYLAYRRHWKATTGLVAGVTSSFLIVQAAFDIFLWGYPFAEFMGYINQNVIDRNSYFNLPWYNYFLTVGGILLPPVSLFLLYGFFRGWKRYLPLFLPAALFFAFHSAFPNKQERFILPFIPVLIMTGAMGYYRYMVPSAFWIRRKTLLRGCWTFFWVINILLLAGTTFMYSKRSKVESMYYLYRYPSLKTVAVADENGGVPLMPLFYTGHWPRIPEVHPPDTTIYQVLGRLAANPGCMHPQFMVFTGSKDLQQRVGKARMSFPLLVYETTIEPGYVDRLMHMLNPVNKAERVYIYRNAEFAGLK